MNVKVISRNPDEYLRDTKRGLHKIKRNYDPELHPMESARKFDRLFVCHCSDTINIPYNFHR